MLLGTVAIFLLAAALHGAVALQNRSNPFASTLIADAQSYREWGERLAQQGLGAEPVFHQAPLFPLALAGMYALTPARLHGPGEIVLAGLLNSLALALLVPLGWRCFGTPAAGLAAGLLALSHGPFIFYGLKLLPTPLALATQAAALLALCTARERRQPRYAALAGVAGGLAIATRAELLLAVPLALVVLGLPVPPRTGRSPRSLILGVTWLFAAAVVLAPITLHNWRRGDRVLVASSAGENLFIGNQPGGSGGHTALHPQAGDLASQRTLARLIAERDQDRLLRPSEVSAYWRGRAWAAIGADPGGWLALEARKLARLAEPDPTDLYSFTLERSRYLTALRLLPLTPACLLLLGALGAAAAWRRGARAAWPVAAWVGLHTIVLLAFFVDTRVRIPWLFFLTPFAGFALVEARRLWSDRSHRTGLVLAACGAVVLLIPGNLPGPPRPRDVIRLAAVLSMQERYDESLRVLAPLLSGPRADAVALDQAGWVLHKSGNLTAARDRYLQALASGLPPLRELQTRTRLAEVHERLGELAEAEAQHEAAAASAQANASTYYQRGMFRLRQGQTAGAVADLQRAMQLDPAWPPPQDALRSLGN